MLNEGCCSEPMLKQGSGAHGGWRSVSADTVRTPYSMYTMTVPNPPYDTAFILTFAMSASQQILLIDGNHVGGSPKTGQDTWNPPEGQRKLTTPMEIFSGPGLLFDLGVYDGVQNDAAIAAVKSRFDSV